MIFIVQDVSRMIFKGRILGGVQNVWANPYLNGTTVLFDILYEIFTKVGCVCSHWGSKDN